MRDLLELALGVLCDEVNKMEGAHEAKIAAEDALKNETKRLQTTIDIRDELAGEVALLSQQKDNLTRQLRYWKSEATKLRKRVAELKGKQ